jgi:hypothetical protein
MGTAAVVVDITATEEDMAVLTEGIMEAGTITEAAVAALGPPGGITGLRADLAGQGPGLSITEGTTTAGAVAAA